MTKTTSKTTKDQTTKMTINETQEEVISEFEGFDDWMDKYQLLIDLGSEQTPLREVQNGTEPDRRLPEPCVGTMRQRGRWYTDIHS